MCIKGKELIAEVHRVVTIEKKRKNDITSTTRENSVWMTVVKALSLHVVRK
jgi:hypothetical protein